MKFRLFLKIIALSFWLFNSYASEASEDPRPYQFRNPALLTEKDRYSFDLSFSEKFADSSGIIAWNVCRPGLSSHSFSFSHEYAFQDNTKNLFHRVTGSFADNPFNRFSYGFNIGSTIKKSNNTWSSYFDLDFGLSYRLMNDPLFGTQIIGTSIQNALTSSIHNKIWHNEPVKLHFSWMSRMFNGRIQPGLAFSLNDLLNDTIDVSFDTYLGFRRFPVEAFILAGKNYIGISAGLFIAFGNGSEFLISSQYIDSPLKWKSGTLSFNLASYFSNSREEKYSRRMLPYLGDFNVEIYNRGIKLYNKAQYFDAIRIFNEMRNEYPEFFRNDFCLYFISSCYAKMGMLNSAKQNFIETKNRYKKSPVVNFADLGLLQIAIEENDSVKIPELADMVLSSHVADSIKQEVLHSLAEYRFMSGDFKSALNEYKKIKDNHSAYIPAQYSIAAIYKYMNSNDSAEQSISVLNRKNDFATKQKIDSLSVLAPVPLELYETVKRSVKKEFSEMQVPCDSLGYAIEMLSQKRQSTSVLLSLDSLHTIQENDFKTVEKYRMINNPLYKKWIMLGNVLLMYLTKEELQVLQKCQSIISEVSKHNDK